MASLSSKTAIFSFLLVSILLSVSVIKVCEAQARPPTARGLSYTFYDKSCPKLKSIVRTELKKVFKNDIAQAAGLLRLHFHDCFVQVTNETAKLGAHAQHLLVVNTPFSATETSCYICL